MNAKKLFLYIIMVLSGILVTACASANVTFEPRGLFTVDGDTLVLHDEASACIRESDAALNLDDGSVLGVTENSMLVASGNVTITMSTLEVLGTFEVVDCEPLTPADLGMPAPVVVQSLDAAPPDAVAACTENANLDAYGADGLPYDCEAIRSLVNGETEPAVVTCDWTVNTNQAPAPLDSLELRADGSTWICSNDGTWILYIPITDETEPANEPTATGETTDPVDLPMPMATDQHNGWDLAYYGGATEQMLNQGDNPWPEYGPLDPAGWPVFPNVSNPLAGFDASHGLEYGMAESEFCGAAGDKCEITVPAMHYRLITGDWSLDGIGSCFTNEEHPEGCALMIVNVGEVTATYTGTLNNVFTVSGRYWHGDFLPEAIVALLSHASANMLGMETMLNPAQSVNAGANCSVPTGCPGVDARFAVTSGNELLVLGQTVYRPE